MIISYMAILVLAKRQCSAKPHAWQKVTEAYLGVHVSQLPVKCLEAGSPHVAARDDLCLTTITTTSTTTYHQSVDFCLSGLQYFTCLQTAKTGRHNGLHWSLYWPKNSAPLPYPHREFTLPPQDPVLCPICRPFSCLRRIWEDGVQQIVTCFGPSQEDVQVQNKWRRKDNTGSSWRMAV